MCLLSVYSAVPCDDFSVVLLDLRVLQQLAPEVGGGARIVDLQDVELLSDLRVQLQLLFLEDRDDLLAEVDREQVLELARLHDLLLGHFDQVGEGPGVAGALEKGAHRRFACVQVVEVLLRGDLLLNQGLLATTADFDLPMRFDLPLCGKSELDIANMTVANLFSGYGGDRLSAFYKAL